MILFLTPVMCAGPKTEPHSKRDDDTDLIVRLANGAVAVVGTDRSRQQDVSLCSVQGACEWRAEEGRMMWTLDWLVMETVVVVVARTGRSAFWSPSGAAGAAGSEARGEDLNGSAANIPARVSRSPRSSGAENFSLGGVFAERGVLRDDEFSDREPGDRYPGTDRRSCAASSAASLNDSAEGLLRADLKENLGLGANVCRCSSSFSRRALMACQM